MFAMALCAMMWTHAGELDAVDGPNVRVKRHEDGSKSVFTRSPDGKVVTKRTQNAAGRVTLVTIYRMDENGNPRACDIYDGRKTRLYKVAYGYETKYGQLVREQMYDCRVRRVWKNNPSEEMPVQVVEYLVNAEGRVAGKPVIRNYHEGNTFERDYGAATSAMDPKMFDEPVSGGTTKPPAGKAPAGGR